MRLLYNNSIKETQYYETDENIRDTLIRDLELDKLSMMINVHEGNNWDTKSLIGLMTSDRDLISFRQQLSRDLFEKKEIYEDLTTIYHKLIGLREISEDMTQTSRKEISNYVIVTKWLDLFCTLIEDFEKFFTVHSESIRADSLLSLKAVIKQISGSNEFKTISKNLNEIIIDNHTMKSIRLGINLNEYLEPVSASCIQINDDYYYPRKVTDIINNNNKVHGIGRFKYIPAGKRREGIIRYDEIHSRTVLVNTTKLQRFISCDLDVEYLKALDTLFKTLNFNSRNIVKRFIIDKTAELIELISDLGFFLGGNKMIRGFVDKGMPVCLPKISRSDDNDYSVSDLYNCFLPGIIMKPSENIVCNDIVLNRDNGFAILNGPNKGGKTTLIQALCLSVILFQLGLYIPGSSAEISPVDMILTHYQRDEKTDRTGRLSIEATSIRSIFRRATRRSLIILNEPYVSTSPSEGMFLILNALDAIRILKCRGMLVTHYHKLNDRVGDDNGNSDYEIVFLNMGIEPTDGSTRRTFELRKGRGEVKSFAMDILKTYAPELLDE